MAKRVQKPAVNLTGIRMKAQAQAESMGLELVEVVMAHENSCDILRYTIDKDAPGGVSLSDCEAFHRSILHLADNIDYDYMEVTSPGADRPLKTERDFARAMGQGVEVHFYRAVNGVKLFKGTLADYDEDSVTLEIEGSESAIPRREIALIRLSLDDEELQSPLFESLESLADTDETTHEGNDNA